MDPSTGTFTSMDTYGGSLTDPMSLHKYLFANSNPVKYCDPSGHMSLVDMDAAMAIECILNAGYISGYLYIIDASITDPGLEHHDMFGYLGAIGCGMLFAVANLVLSATVTGLLILAIIDTLLGVAGVAKGIADIRDGHIGYGITEILASIAGTAIGWKNFASARAAARATEIADSTERKTNTRRSENNGGSTGSEGGLESIIKNGTISIDDIKANPSIFSGKSVDEIAKVLTDSGYDVTVKGKRLII